MVQASSKTERRFHYTMWIQDNPIMSSFLFIFHFIERYKKIVDMERWEAKKQQFVRKQEEKKPEIAKEKSRKLKMPVEKETSLRKQEICVGQSISSSDDDDERPPAPTSDPVPTAPKVVPVRSITKLVERQPLLVRFYDHMVTFEGGSKEPKTASDTVQRVGRLLFEVDESLENANLLWNEEAIVHIRSSFIEGNPLLEKPRRVGTLRSYLTALLTFYHFLITRATSLSENFGLTQNDINRVKEYIPRVSTWMKSFSDDVADRKVEVHKQDYIELVTSEQYWNLINSPEHEKFEQRFRDLDDNAASEFVPLRDYLITVLLVHSAQRAGAVCNLTLEEFETGKWDESTQDKQYITLTKKHKTRSKI